MIDFLASLPKYRAHLTPVWEGLPASLRGEYIDLSINRRPPGNGAALVAGYMDYRAARRAGYRKIALLEHGIGQSYSGRDAHLPGGDDRGSVGLFLSPNETAAERDRARYPRAKAVVVGSPVLDSLPQREKGPGPVVAITWHWHNTKVPEMRSAWEHFRNALPALAERYALIGHVHPQAVGMVAPTYERLGIEYDPDYRAVFRRADVLIADNTSAMFEFASTGRPVVVLNAPEYRRDVNHGLRFWDAADVGVNCDDPADLPDAVAEALKDSPAQKAIRKAALRIVYGFQKGAAKRAAKEIAAWL